jgi:hypothetical protein
MAKSGLAQLLQSKGIKALGVRVLKTRVIIQFKYSTETIFTKCNGKFLPLSSVIQRYINESIPLRGNSVWRFNAEGFLEGKRVK